MQPLPFTLSLLLTPMYIHARLNGPCKTLAHPAFVGTSCHTARRINLPSFDHRLDAVGNGDVHVERSPARNNFDGEEKSISEGACLSSHIVSVKSSNIAGMSGSDYNDGGVEVNFGSEACFVAVTGESGVGKSILVSKAVDLVTGGKATSSLISLPNGERGEQDVPSSVELNVNLYEPHLSEVSAALLNYGVDPSILYEAAGSKHGDGKSKVGQLKITRDLLLHSSGRLKSVCRINGKHISLKSLRNIAAPLFTRVDVGAASTALGRPSSRLAMLDMGVSDNLKLQCAELRDVYKQAQKRKKKIKSELESRVLPLNYSTENSSGKSIEEGRVELLQHWIDELDAFESRIVKFRDAIINHYNDVMTNEYYSTDSSGNDSLTISIQNLKDSSWERKSSDEQSLFAALLEFREEIKAVGVQLESANSAYEALASLASQDSATVALEKVRKLLYSISREDSGKLFEKVEKTHELLNTVEESLHECARSIDGDSNSLVSTLENMVCNGVSIEEIDNVIADWNSLARKHGISPYSLPACHASLREELDGDVEALRLLPEAEQMERIALENFSKSCKELSEARTEVATHLSRSVTKLLPSLGLEGSIFQVQLNLRRGGLEDPYNGPDSIGVDMADFLLLHQKENNLDSSGEAAEEIPGTQRGGNIDQVGSSGEKSRVLLAIETSLPGSIGTTCNAHNNGPDIGKIDGYQRVRPISIIYDEIDAHVGGRAAVTMAKLLADQTRKGPNGFDDRRMSGSQIIAITHSAPVAAIADRHIVVERDAKGSSSRTSPVLTYVADGPERRKEIARMTSGDLAPGEAEAFAEALIRDGSIQRDAPHIY